MSRKRQGTAAAACLVVVGAALGAFSATRVWWSAVGDTPVGPRQVTATGSATVPELIPVALVALAGLGAALATGGIARRCIGALIALAGLFVAGRSLFGFADPPSAELATVLGPAGGPFTAESATVHPVGPVLAGIGGLLITAGGLMLALRRAPGTGLGRRYDRTSRTDSASTGPASGAAPAVVDADLWKAMDSGADPTVDPTADPTVDPTAGSAGSDRPSAGG